MNFQDGQEDAPENIINFPQEQPKDFRGCYGRDIDELFLEHLEIAIANAAGALVAWREHDEEKTFQRVGYFFEAAQLVAQCALELLLQRKAEQ